MIRYASPSPHPTLFMKTDLKRIPTLALSLTIAMTACFWPSPARAGIEPEARALAKEVAAKLQDARTIRLSASHKIAPSLGVGSKLERGPLEITVKRPNQFHAIQKAGAETRVLAFDGRYLAVIHPEVKHHALEPLRASSIEQFADRVDERFGFRPPVAELLANDLESNLFIHVTSAKVIPDQWLGWARCDCLHLEQAGMTVDLWIGAKDRLPRRLLLTFTDRAGHPTWDIRLKKWELNGPVDQALFSQRPAGDSTKVQMVRSR